MTFVQRRNCLTTHFSERIHVVKRRMTTLCWQNVEFETVKPGGTYSNHWALNGYTYLYVMWRSTRLYYAHSQNCEELLLASSCLSVCLSPSFIARACGCACVEQFGSHWTNFHEIWYLGVFRKSVEKIQMSFKSDQNNRYFTWGPSYICGNISPNFS